MEADGLKKPWKGRLWLNPPYSTELMEKFIDKLGEEIEAGNVVEFCALTNNSTETQWFRKLASMSIAIAFPEGRIRYWSPKKESKTPLQGQAIFYGGSHYLEFERAFRKFCLICDIT